MKRCLLYLLLAIALVRGGAEELGRALELALARDAAYAQRLAEARGSALSLEALASPSPATLSLTSGQGRLSLPAGGNPSLVVQPSLGILLSEPWNTNATLGLYGDIDLADPGLSAWKPSLGLSQPLDRWLWGPAPDAERAKLENDLLAADEGVAKRRAELRAELYADLRAARNAEYSVAQARYALDIAQRALADARAAGTYSEASSAMAKLRLDLASAEAGLAKAERQEAFQKGVLERLVGEALDPLPAPPEAGAAAPPDPQEASRALAAAVARRGYELALLKYGIDYGPPAKSLVASLSASSAATDYGAGSWDYSGRLAFGRGDLSVSLGGGAVTMRKDGSKIPYLSFKADWKPANAAAKAASAGAAAAALEAQALAASAAEAQARASLEDYARQARELEDDEALAAAQRAYADALLAEKEKALAAGIAGEDELAQARWARDKLDIESELARWDRAILELKIAAIFPQEGQP